MNDDLLECKQKALDLVKSSNPAWLDSGRKKGYMAVMKDLWETKGYYELMPSEVTVGFYQMRKLLLCRILTPAPIR